MRMPCMACFHHLAVLLLLLCPSHSGSLAAAAAAAPYQLPLQRHDALQAGVPSTAVKDDEDDNDYSVDSIRWKDGQLGDHDYTPYASSSLPLPSSPLPWGDLNILSTTDTHGWVRGHLHSAFPPEANYGGDVGDLQAFRYHLGRIADDRGVDLLFVDSGDTVDGNGFVDADSSGIKGYRAREILKRLEWNITTTGNHELYNRTVAQNVYRDFIPSFKGRYLSSNVFIEVEDRLGSSSDKHATTPPSASASPPHPHPPAQYTSVTLQPFGAQYHHFVTPNRGLRVTSFGVLFNFDRPDRGLVVQPPREMIQEEWWKRVLKEVETDVYVLVGHLATRDSDWLAVHKSIRSVHPHTPILIFSGHAHVRDCVRPDANTQILASGRYMETVGFTALSMSESPNDSSARSHRATRIARRYLDTNLVTYHYHSNKTQADFLTPQAKRMKRELNYWSKQFNLTYAFGTAPQSYYLNRYPVTHHKSLINLYAEKVFNSVLAASQRHVTAGGKGGEMEPVFLFNTGAARFDVFKGPFTVDDQLTVVPFENGLWYIHALDRSLVEKLLVWLNNLLGEPEFAASSWAAEAFESMGVPPDQRARNLQILKDSLETCRQRRRQTSDYAALMASPEHARLFTAPVIDEDSDDEELEVSHALKRKLTYGYVTQDLCSPVPGDDTPHRPLPAFDIPDFVLSIKPETAASVRSATSDIDAAGDDKVNLIFYEFIAPLVLKGLNALQTQRAYDHRDVAVYSELKANELLGEYARMAWN